MTGTIDSASIEATDPISGILFSRSVRSSYTSLSLVPTEKHSEVQSSAKEDERQPILVRLQFFGDATELRSFCRRKYKLGDLIEIHGGTFQQLQNEQGTAWTAPRVVVDVKSTDEAIKLIYIRQPQVWNMTECQQWQNRFFPKAQCGKKTASSEGKKPKPKSNLNEKVDRDHGSGLAKRLQGNHITAMLIHAVMVKLADPLKHKTPKEPSQWHLLDGETYIDLKKEAIKYLNSGSGVVDVAGGSGHVSMAMGLAGIKCTVVDARASVGKLPGRDRKIWNRAMKHGFPSEKMKDINYCQPIVPFQAHRAWFGSKPAGVDSSFRHPDEDELPLCDETSDLLSKSSAIVALHPDEATGDAVRIAVSRRIPFVIVPCCVFCRLYPNRRKPSDGQVVSSYEDLVEYLQAQDESIERTKMPFDGKNLALWSIFRDMTN